jgi:hypothetical protein
MGFVEKFVAWMWFAIFCLVMMFALEQIGAITGTTAFISGFVLVIGSLIIVSMPGVEDVISDILKGLSGSSKY